MSEIAHGAKHVCMNMDLDVNSGMYGTTLTSASRWHMHTALLFFMRKILRSWPPPPPPLLLRTLDVCLYHDSDCSSFSTVPLHMVFWLQC